MKKFINPLLRLGTAIALLSVIYIQNKELHQLKQTKPIVHISKNDSLEAVVDSLELELFNVQTLNGRYEITLEQLKEVNPKAAQQFEKIYNNETE